MEFIALLFGISIGSFVNVLIDRLPQGESIVFGRSHCDYCKRVLRWYELIPVLSFLVQKGSCRRCHKKLSWQYPSIELLTGIGFAYITHQVLANGFDAYWAIHLVSYLVIFVALLVLVVADLKTYILPDSMIVLGMFGAILLLLFPFDRSLFEAHVVSGLAASGVFFSLWAVTRGRGMGFGDVKLALLLGLLSGFPGIVMTLYVAFLTGAVVGVILVLLKKRSIKSHVPFGPFLIWGYCVSILFNEQLFALWKLMF